MQDVSIEVLEAVVAHATKKEPGVDVCILVSGCWVLALGSTVNIHGSKVARELTLVFGNQTPLGILFSLGTFNEKSADLVSSELKPEHVVCQVEIEVILLGV